MGAQGRTWPRIGRIVLMAITVGSLVALGVPSATAETSPDYHSERYEIDSWCTSNYTVGGATAKPLASFAANWRMTFGSGAWMTRITTGDNQDPRFSTTWDWHTGEAGDKCGTNEKAFAERIKVYGIYVLTFDTTSCRIVPSLSVGIKGLSPSVSGDCSGGHGSKTWKFVKVCEPADGKVNSCTLNIGKLVFSAPDGVRLTGLGRRTDVDLRASKSASDYGFGTRLCGAGSSDSGLRCDA